MPPIRTSALAFCIALIGSAGPAAAELPLDAIKDEQVRTRLRQVGLQLAFGEAVPAMTNAHAVGWEVFHRGDEGRTRELAYALVLQAVAEATLNLDREALWHWTAAQVILPELRSEVLGSYSGIVELFEDSPFRDQASAVAWLREKEAFLEQPEGAPPPQLIQKTPIPTPDRKSSALRGQQVSVSYLLDPEGRLYAPKVEKGASHPLAVFTVLHSLLGWRYESLATDQAAGWLRLTSTFSFDHKK